jgi:hypothetical protein
LYIHMYHLLPLPLPGFLRYYNHVKKWQDPFIW